VNRTQLAYILKKACQIVEDPNALVVGSQAILGAHDDSELPEEASRSIEADIAFWNDPDNEKADEIDIRIGEQSGFHEIHGVYAQGVSLSTAILPAGWEERCVALDEAKPESVAVCVEKNDLVISKLVAGRRKDIEFAQALIAADLIDVTTLLERAEALPRPRPVISSVIDAINRCARTAEQA
jgi:hypothetical protein